MHSDDPQQRKLLRVCRIGRAQGLKGEVNVRPFTDEPERRFAPGSILYTEDGSREFRVLRSRTHRDRWIVLFEGVTDRNASEALNGLELYGEPATEEELAEEDAWYPEDLIGLEARWDEENQLGHPAGEVIGTVTNLLESPAQYLLEVAVPMPTEDDPEATAPVLVPFVDEIVPEIDLDEGYLTLDPPGGLIPER
ncbi:ribosome maturation factor RimM [Bifidobacterium vespertilionis]|uniref:Ribosome maturation factor RimM n=1 Tax=Bifidobacterium vespertilionis TaxID=2562524 RepID=A0A5J5DU62_9BIFI|nr:ribosome maturation factor RimM [Bifidobacterium vespertilionis]KAA8819043.1 ribosome maturation factor RimM [Bifidobacterium vespertilionis]KAA8822161.1 ribosome maturation factor RimM [Bifidobacterium vespertilionis]MBT1180301.1 ribosome maturation factor RimM [Bifidobacterium vespertilionis]